MYNLLISKSQIDLESQRCRIVDANAQCKRTLRRFPYLAAITGYVTLRDTINNGRCFSSNGTRDG